MPVKRIAVVGAGVVGVTSALRIQESLEGAEVTLIAEKFSPDTTGDGSGGFIKIYSLGEDTDEELARRWCKETMEFFGKIAKSEEAGLLGVGFMQAYWIFESGEALVEPMDTLIHSHPMTEKELSMFPPEYTSGLTGTSLFAECKRLLPGLTKRFQDLGGRVIKKRLGKLQELCGSYDVVVNCSGIGAAQLVQDSLVYPVRGQVIKVRAPWIKHAILTSKIHILPVGDSITLGGTHQKGNWNTKVDEEDKKRIFEGCCKVVPSLKNAEIITDWVGLRPLRNSLRLEREMIQDGGKTLEVIHNYGHGGSGVSISWGCAGDVLKLLREL